MAKKSSFLLRGNTILKIQFEFAPSNREIELLIAFFGLPNAIDNPLPLIVIKFFGIGDRSIRGRCGMASLTS